MKEIAKIILILVIISVVYSLFVEMSNIFRIKSDIQYANYLSSRYTILQPPSMEMLALRRGYLSANDSINAFIEYFDKTYRGIYSVTSSRSVESVTVTLTPIVSSDKETLIAEMRMTGRIFLDGANYYTGIETKITSRSKFVAPTTKAILPAVVNEVSFTKRFNIRAGAE